MNTKKDELEESKNVWLCACVCINVNMESEQIFETQKLPCEKY